MKRVLRYILRATLAVGLAFLLSLMGGSITLPINIVTLAASVFLGAPGVALALLLCNYIF